MSVQRVLCWVSIGGTQMPAIDVRVTRKSKRSADTFSANLAIETTSLYGYGYAEWADFQPQDVAIIGQVGDGDPVQMVVGLVDKPEIEWNEGRVSISGRDKSAGLIEKRHSKKYPNNSYSDIVNQVAQDHGLTASVQGEAAVAGKTYSTDTVHHHINRTDFELMSSIAEATGSRWYVDGNTLVLEPVDQSTGVLDFYHYPPGTMRPYAVSNCLELKTSRNMTAAKPHTSTGNSWHHEKKQLYQSQETAGGVGETIQLLQNHNGRTQEQLDRLVKGRLKDAIRHDLSVTVEAPADLGATPRMSGSLRGTGTIYDQSYDVDSVDFALGWDGGGKMTVEMKSPKAGRTS